MEQKIRDILSRMSLEDKISLCNGADFWRSKAMEQYGIPAFMMSDGPHGLRVQKGDADMLGVNSKPAGNSQATSGNSNLVVFSPEARVQRTLLKGISSPLLL